MLTLGIETSCDETSAAVVKDGSFVLSNIVASSVELHKKYSGIIPEIAARAQVEYISLVTEEAISKAKIRLKDIDLICVTKEPGLIGSLLVGISFAKSISFALGKPLIDVDHLEAHLYANFLSCDKTKRASPLFSLLSKKPFIGLIVSGGHTSLFLVRRNFNFTLLGSTIDDAAGEAFDKAAKILGLGYPGGPFIEKMAKRGDEKVVKLSCLGLENLDFSFSGIKTAVLYKAKENSSDYSNADIAAGFQKAVVDALIKKTFLACRRKNADIIIIGGGVAKNSYLKMRFKDEAKLEKISVYFPHSDLTLDNAAMVAGLGYQLFRGRGIVRDSASK